ncbi:MAG: DUF4126 domain-containing protein [Rubrobacteraceae bacterium]
MLLIGIGVGLASVAGLRAFLPLAVAGLFALFGLFEIALPFGLIADPVVLAALFVLALVEGGLDKVSSIQRGVNLAMIPLRVISGAILFAAATGAGLYASAAPELVAGGVIAGVVAVLKVMLRPSGSASSAGVSQNSLSGFEDLVSFVGGAVAVFVPFLTAVFAAFVLFFFYRVKKRRGRKYEGLRILGD